MKRKKNNLHLTITDRREIENLLNEGKQLQKFPILFLKTEVTFQEKSKNIFIFIFLLRSTINGIA